MDLVDSKVHFGSLFSTCVVSLLLFAFSRNVTTFFDLSVQASNDTTLFRTKALHF